jgi:hypothetical protein
MASAPSPTAAPTYGNRYRLKVVAASINPTRPDGSAWHMKPPDRGGMMLLGILVGASFGGMAGAEMGANVGGAMAGDAKMHPPSPRAELRIGGQLFETFPVPATLSPRWDYGFALDVRDFGPTTRVVLAVRDVDGDEVVGEKSMTLADLLGTPSRIESMGSVTSFQVTVESLPDVPEPKTLRFQVPTDVSIEDNAKEVANRPRFEGDWQGIPVLNGDVIRVRASGKVCPSSFHSETCSGPEGFSQFGDWLTYNRPEFRDLAHASLVAMVAGRPLFVGTGVEFTVERPGVLLLGVNDKDTGNNSGGFQVTVEVNPPDLVRQRAPATPGYQAPTWNSAPAPSPQ